MPDDITQSPVPGSDTQNPGQAPGQEGQQESPLNKRFAELSGTIREQREALNQQTALINQLMATQAQLAQSIHQPQAPAHQGFEVQLPDGIDPAQAQFFQNLTKSFQSQLELANKRTEEAIGRAVGGVRQSQEQMELAQAMNGQPREVAELAQRLLGDWRNKGYTGWAPKDAITFARGQLGVPAQTRRQAVDDMVPGGSMSPDPRGSAQLPPPLPDEQLRKMSLKDQEDYWAKRVGDSPLVF